MEKGARWNNEISKELGNSQIGIFAMTEENLTSPWIMFEAGAISKVVDESRVCAIVFGIRKTDLKGPLTSFQTIEFTRTEVRQLLSTINNNAAKEAALTERTLDEAFNMWWPRLEERVQAISSAGQPSSGPQRSERDLLEEAVSNTRTLLREFQMLPSWQRFTMSPQMQAIKNSLRGQKSPARGILDLPDEPPSGEPPTEPV
jgi:hypothetical protein